MEVDSSNPNHNISLGLLSVQEREGGRREGKKEGEGERMSQQASLLLGLPRISNKVQGLQIENCLTKAEMSV